MKTRKLTGFLAASLVLSTVCAHAQKGTLVFPRPPRTNAPPKDFIVEPPPPPLATLTNQPKRASKHSHKSSSAKPVLVTPEQAQTILKNFKEAYPKLGSPRVFIYVNRAAAETQPAGDPQDTFGRLLRDGGANLADPKAAAQVMADKPLDNFVGSSDTPEARKDREALNQIADVVIEVLVGSKDVTLPADAGGQTITVPDIQATAISLKDSKILGQASSSDVTSRVPPSALGSFRAGDIAEATALTLMEDMTPKP